MAEFVEEGNSRERETYVSVEDGVVGEPPPGLWGGCLPTPTGLGTGPGMAHQPPHRPWGGRRPTSLTTVF
jgi:hypothetical protein